VVVLKLSKSGNRQLPYGEAFMDFNGKPAVILHLPSLTLWVTSRYSDGGKALRCFRLGRNDQPSDEYSEQGISLRKYEEHCRQYEFMREVQETG